MAQNNQEFDRLQQKYQPVCLSVPKFASHSEKEVKQNADKNNGYSSHRDAVDSENPRSAPAGG
jgi:hypothetical protein